MKIILVFLSYFFSATVLYSQIETDSILKKISNYTNINIFKLKDEKNLVALKFEGDSNIAKSKYHYKTYSYWYQVNNMNTFSASLMILYKNENVLGASIGIGAAKKNILLCDGIKRQKDGYSIVDTCYKDKYSGCDYLSIKILAPAEMKLIRNLNLDSAIIKEIMKEYLDFGLDSTVHNTAFIFPYKEFQNPIYSNLASEVIYKLIKGKKYNEAVLLCHSKNDTYNWFLADGIMYYNKKLNFLKPRQYKFINHFNGKNGFRKFRTNEFGALAYPDIDR